MNRIIKPGNVIQFVTQPDIRGVIEAFLVKVCPGGPRPEYRVAWIDHEGAPQRMDTAIEMVRVSSPAEDSYFEESELDTLLEEAPPFWAVSAVSKGSDGVPPKGALIRATDRNTSGRVTAHQAAMGDPKS